MDTVVSQLNAVGLDGRAGDAAAVRERVDQVLKQTATVRRSVDGLLARILALADGGPGAGISSAAAGRPGPPLLRPGLDPGLEKGALGDRFQPGVHDPDGMFEPKERTIAALIIAPGGVAVHPRRRDDTVAYRRNPDSMVRVGPSDPGTITEFKTLDRGTNAAVKRDILGAGRQVDAYGGGDAVIDGRNVALTADEAVRGYRRAAGTGRSMPTRVSVVLGDGSILKFPEN